MKSNLKNKLTIVLSLCFTYSLRGKKVNNHELMMLLDSLKNLLLFLI
jgi:hypothetical protein